MVHISEDIKSGVHCTFAGLDKDAHVVEEGSYPDALPEESAACIHLGSRMTKTGGGKKVLFHTHSVNATALGCLKGDIFVPSHQNYLRFHDRFAVYEDYDVANLKTDEGQFIGRSMGDKDILFMQNHGVMIASDTVHLAFDDAYYLERACLYQVNIF